MPRLPFLSSLLLILLLAACSPGGDGDLWQLKRDSLRYASLLEIERADSFVLVTVKDAWMAEQDLHRYILVDREAQMPKAVPEGTVLRTPLRYVVMHNAVHAALTAELGKVGAIAGLCDVDYVQTPALQHLLEQGFIADAGSSVQSDVERYISLRTEAVFTSPLEHANYGVLEKVGIPIVECADYMEPTALGRAEWMLLFGLLFDCEEQANELFSQVEKHYLALCDSVKNVSQRPRVMTDMMNGSTWYMPGGGSYLGNLLKDAGADYVLAHDKRSGSVPLSFESVFAMAAEADLWLIKQARNHRPTYAELKNEHATYASFRPWKERTIYFCNTLSTDIYERIPFHPDVLLKELIYLFHPESINTPHEAVYYLPLE